MALTGPAKLFYSRAMHAEEACDHYRKELADSKALFEQVAERHALIYGAVLDLIEPMIQQGRSVELLCHPNEGVRSATKCYLEVRDKYKDRPDRLERRKKWISRKDRLQIEDEEV